MSCRQKYGWRLEQLTRLLKDGAITQEQYDKKDLQNKLQYLQEESSSPSDSPSKSAQNVEKVIGRLNKYATCELALHRFSLVRELLDYATVMGPSNSVLHLPQVLSLLAKDQETLVRQGVAEQIPELSSFLFEKVGNKEEISVFIAEKFLPVLTELLQDAQAIQVREMALAALLELVPKFSVAHIKLFILPILEMFAKDENDEDNRVQAAGILNEIAPTMGPELTIKHGLPILAMLVEDPTFRVRKAAASSLNLIASTIGIEQTTKLLLPMYLGLAKDEIWGVRKACADSLVGISSFLTYEKRTTELVPLYELFADDKSRWVRSAAREALGPFIATYGENSQVPETLLNHFRALAVREPTEDQTEEQNDADHPTFCAFNFPGVLITLGAERWPELRDTYSVLVKDLQWKVRRTLSFSLHVVAEILGRKITEETLLPTFELFLRDLDEVKVGVIKNFSKFIKILSPKIRKNYLLVLEELKEPKVNWRFRRLITKQLGDLAVLYDAHSLETTVLPVALKLQLDPVAAVRKALYGQLGIVINCLSATNNGAAPSGPEGVTPSPPASPSSDRTLNEVDTLDERRNQFFNFVKDLANHNSYRNRLTFCELCGSSVGVLEKHIFDEVFFQPLLKLVSDNVPNVRVAVASALKKIKEQDKYKDDEQIAQALEKMKQDKDSEVVVTVGGVPPLKKTRKNKNNQ